MDHVKNLWSSYLQWVAEHPQLATDIETSIKWISYLATGMYLKPAIKSTYLIDVRYVHMYTCGFLHARCTIFNGISFHDIFEIFF